jgi:hypothetical protein
MMLHKIRPPEWIVAMPSAMIAGLNTSSLKSKRVRVGV